MHPVAAAARATVIRMVRRLMTALLAVLGQGFSPADSRTARSVRQPHAGGSCKAGGRTVARPLGTVICGRLLVTISMRDGEPPAFPKRPRRDAQRRRRLAALVLALDDQL